MAVYRYTEDFPKTETYGLTSQLRRAAISIAANIAEGFRKHGLPDKRRFYNIAEGSIEECRYYLILATDLGYGENQKLQRLLVETSKLLESYSRSILNSVS